VVGRAQRKEGGLLLIIEKRKKKGMGLRRLEGQIGPKKKGGAKGGGGIPSRTSTGREAKNFMVRGSRRGGR